MVSPVSSLAVLPVANPRSLSGIAGLESRQAPLSGTLADLARSTSPRVAPDQSSDRKFRCLDDTRDFPHPNSDGTVSQRLQPNFGRCERLHVRLEVNQERLIRRVGLVTGSRSTPPTLEGLSAESPLGVSTLPHCFTRQQMRGF